MQANGWRGKAGALVGRNLIFIPARISDPYHLALPMHTIAFLFKRRPDMSLFEFHHHYKEVHGPIARTLPGLIEYRQYPVRDAGMGDVHFRADSGFDGLSIFVFESTEVAEAAWHSPENGPVQEDTLKFIDLETMITLPLTLRPVLTPLEEAP